jgi:hypothetical protein
LVAYQPSYSSSQPQAATARSLLVEASLDRAEVEAATVRLEPELHRRDPDVRAGHDPPVVVDDLALRDDGRQRCIVDTSEEQLLEPGVGHVALVRDAVEEPQQGSGPGRTWAMQPLGGVPQSDRGGALAWCARQCPTDELAIHHGAEVGQRSSDGRARQPAHGGHVDVLERRDVVVTVFGRSSRKSRVTLPSITAMPG